MGPDLCSFGPFFLTRLGDLGERIAHRSGPPDPSTIPAYVYHAYDVSHSLVVWAAVFGLVWFLRKKPFWPLGAWALHILCDIPTHSVRFFPTPYVWPFATPFYDGTPWGYRAFMIWNYVAITTAYVAVWFWKRKLKTPSA